MFSDKSWQRVSDDLLCACIETCPAEDEHGSQQILLLVARSPSSASPAEAVEAGEERGGRLMRIQHNLMRSQELGRAGRCTGLANLTRSSH